MCLLICSIGLCVCDVILLVVYFVNLYSVGALFTDTVGRVRKCNRIHCMRLRKPMFSYPSYFEVFICIYIKPRTTRAVVVATAIMMTTAAMATYSQYPFTFVIPYTKKEEEEESSHFFHASFMANIYTAHQ